MHVPVLIPCRAGQTFFIAETSSNDRPHTSLSILKQTRMCGSSRQRHQPPRQQRSSAAQELFACGANSNSLSFTPKPRRLGQAYQARGHASIKRSLRMKLKAIGDGARLAAHHCRVAVHSNRPALATRHTRPRSRDADVQRLQYAPHAGLSCYGGGKAEIPCRTTRLFSLKRLDSAVLC